MHWSELTSDLKYFLKLIIKGGRANLSKIEPTNENFEKWSKLRNRI